jgi:hypothetical protein
MRSLVVVKVFAIKLVDCCVHAIFIAVEWRACLRSSLRPESIVHMTIVMIEHLRSSLQSIKSFMIIVAVKLLAHATIIAAELVLLRSSLRMKLLVLHDHRGCRTCSSERLLSRSNNQFVIVFVTELERSCDHHRNLHRNQPCRKRLCSRTACLFERPSLQLNKSFANILGDQACLFTSIVVSKWIICTHRCK